MDLVLILSILHTMVIFKMIVSRFWDVLKASLFMSMDVLPFIYLFWVLARVLSCTSILLKHTHTYAYILTSIKLSILHLFRYGMSKMGSKNRVPSSATLLGYQLRILVWFKWLLQQKLCFFVMWQCFKWKDCRVFPFACTLMPSRMQLL